MRDVNVNRNMQDTRSLHGIENTSTQIHEGNMFAVQCTLYRFFYLHHIAQINE